MGAGSMREEAEDEGQRAPRLLNLRSEWQSVDFHSKPSETGAWLAAV